MKIKLASVFVEDQDKALKFYVDVLGFVKNKEVPVGAFKWLTVVSPEGSKAYAARSRVSWSAHQSGADNNSNL